MGLQVLLLGSTGMVGKGVLLECLEDSRVSAVLVLNRRPVGIQHSKLTEMIVRDFDDLSVLDNKLSGMDACFFCLGVTAAGKDEATYSRLTYDLTTRVASTFISQSPQAVFCYVSGAGTDSSEKGRAMWARVKGRTENQLLAMPFRASYMFRPGYIQPLKGVRSTIGWYNGFYTVLKPLYSLLRPLKKYVTDSVTLGKAMIEVAVSGYPKFILESDDINAIGRK